MSLFLDVPVTSDTIVVGISLSATWASGINRAAAVLRQRHPTADDAEIMGLMLLHGIVGVINHANNERYPRNAHDDELCEQAEGAL